MMSDGMIGNGMGFGMLFGMVFWIILLVGIVFFVVWVVWGPLRRPPQHSHESALEILKKRYARGEISKEEFEEKKRDIL
jgi:putative membrane protein